MRAEQRVNRRRFILGAGIAAAAAAVPRAVLASVTTNDPPKPKKAPAVPLHSLGKTGLMLSAVSLGTGSGPPVNVIKYALSKGVNFIHTSTQYKGGKAIRSLADALKSVKETPHLGLKITWTPDDIGEFDTALATLGVDSVDIAFFNIHNADDVKKPDYRKAAVALKKAGKCRFIGLTTHGDIKNCMTVALDQGFYDCLMPSYNISMAEEFAPVFERAAKNGVGMVLMKTRKGLDETSYTTAIGEYLATPAVTTINKGMTSFAQVNSYVDAAATPAGEQARKDVAAAARAAAFGTCAMCGACTAACPRGLAVADMVRCSDYYMADMAQMETGRETYAALPRAQRAEACDDCGACERACPRTVPVRHHIARAKSLLA